MQPLSPNTLLRPVLTLGALADRHALVPWRRIWIKDPHGRFVFANASLLADAGRDVLGMVDADLPWAERAIEYAASDAEALEGTTVMLRESVRSADGREYQVLTQKSACSMRGVRWWARLGSTIRRRCSANAGRQNGAAASARRLPRRQSGLRWLLTFSAGVMRHAVAQSLVRASVAEITTVPAAAIRAALAAHG